MTAALVERITAEVEDPGLAEAIVHAILGNEACRRELLEALTYQPTVTDHYDPQASGPAIMVVEGSGLTDVNPDHSPTVAAANGWEDAEWTIVPLLAPRSLEAPCP